MVMRFVGKIAEEKKMTFWAYHTGTMVIHTLSLELRLQKPIHTTREIDRCKLCGTFQRSFQKVHQRLWAPSATEIAASRVSRGIEAMDIYPAK